MVEIKCEMKRKEHQYSIPLSCWLHVAGSHGGLLPGQCHLESTVV